MNRPKFEEILARSNPGAQRTLDELRRLAEIIDPPPLPATVIRDPSDDAVLALAAASQADLLILGSHAGIPIICPMPELRGASTFGIAPCQDHRDHDGGAMSGYAAFLKSPICASNARLKAGRAVQRST